MLIEKPIPSNTKWIVGSKYRFVFKINAWKIPFTDVNLISDEMKYRKVEDLVDSFEQSHKDKLRIDNWNAYFTPGYTDKLEIDVTAIGESSPVLIIAVGLIGLAAIIGLIVWTDHISELVDKIGKVNIGIGAIGLGIIGIGIVAFLILGRTNVN